MTVNTKLFRAYDIRGHLDDLTPAVITAIAQALVHYYQKAQQQHIVIGYDARLDSPMYAKIMYHIFQQHGFDVQVIGQCTSPMLYFTAQQFDGNGIMVTASHNPKHDNGIKWICQTHPPSPEEIQQVGQDAQTYYDEHIQIPSIQPDEHFEYFYQQYQHYITQDIQLSRPFKLVLDGLNGSAGRIAERLCKQLKCEVIALRCHANGHFPHHAPDPSIEAHLQDIKRTVVEQSADLGIALDGDGDRLVLIDEHGQMIDADRSLCLFAELCLKQQPHAEIVYDVKCSSLVKRTILQHGGTPSMIRTGSSFLRAYLQHSNAMFAGEFSGHYMFNDGRGLGYDDGIYAGLRIVEYLDKTGQTLSQALAPYPKRCGTEDIYIPLYDYIVKDVLQQVKKHLAHDSNHISEIDGIRCDFDDGFITLRASNTGEYFTLRFDADSPTRLYELQQLLQNSLTNYPKIMQHLPAN